MISANGGLPAHRYTPQVTQGWPRGSEPASAVRFALFCGRCGAVLLLGALCVALCLSLGGVLCPRCVPPAVLCWGWWPACRVGSFPLAGAVCCCLWLPAVRCWVWLPAVFFLWCVLSWLLLPGRVACYPAVCCDSLWCRVPLHRVRVLWCCVALRCRAVARCCPASFAGGVVCVFPRCVRCRVALRVVLFGAGLVCAVVGASRCGVSLCVVVPPLAFCGVVVLLWCVVASCCAVLCSVVLSRLVVPCCCAVLCCAFCFAAVVRISSKKHFAVFENQNKRKLDKIILYPTYASRQAAIPRSFC